MQNHIGQVPDPIGNISPPPAISGKLGTQPGSAIGSLLNIGLNLLIVIAGIYALFNFVLAGYAFLSAGNDPKKIEGAWAKIWQSIIGLVVAAGSVTIAALIGKLIFGRETAIINPSIPTP